MHENIFELHVLAFKYWMEIPYIHVTTEKKCDQINTFMICTEKSKHFTKKKTFLASKLIEVIWSHMRAHEQNKAKILVTYLKPLEQGMGN